VSALLAWWPVPAAFAAMFLQDVLGVWLVQAEAARLAHRAARWDTAQDACRFAGQAAGLGTVLLGHDLAVKAAVVAATLTADYLGTYTGVRLGQWLDKRKGAVQS
jgi:hypothetical protein